MDYKTLNLIAFASARKPYRIWLLISPKDDDFGEISVSVTEQSCVASIFKKDRHKTDRCSYYTGQLFVSAGKGIWNGVSIAFESAYLTARLLFSPHEHQT